MPESTVKSPRAQKKQAPAIEVEARLRVVERCISIGIYDTKSIEAELKNQGFEAQKSAVYSDIKKVKNRLREEDAELRSLRKSILIRDIQRYERVIFGRLIDSNKTPRWRDLVQLLRVRQAVEVGRFEDLPRLPKQERDVDLNLKNNEEIDAMIYAMLEKVGIAPETIGEAQKETVS